MRERLNVLFIRETSTGLSFTLGDGSSFHVSGEFIEQDFYQKCYLGKIKEIELESIELRDIVGYDVKEIFFQNKRVYPV